MAQNTHFGYWNPNDLGTLPEHSELDFGAWYILEDGIVEDKSYTEGDWLIYVCDLRGTLSERSYWRTSKGVVLFDKDGSANLPDPGNYTKVKLDNKGNIIDGLSLELGDMPQELLDKIDSLNEEEISKITAKVIREMFVTNSLNPVQFVYDENTKTLSADLNLDEDTINVNEFGQLYSAGGTGEGGGTGGPCVHHEHNAQEIIGLDEYFKDQMNSFGIKDAISENLVDLVDGQTVVVNKYGQLAAVAAAVQKHHHTMDDITDLDKKKADTWASEQRLHVADPSLVDKGELKIGTLTLGEILIAFNNLFKKHSADIAEAVHKNQTLEPSEPNKIDSARFTVDGLNKLNLLNVETRFTEDCWMCPRVETKDIIFQDNHTLTAYVDGEEKETLKCFNDGESTFGKGQYGNFEITYYGDAYVGSPIFQGYYKGYSFKYNLPQGLSEGVHTVQFKTTNVMTNEDVLSDELKINVYELVDPVLESVEVSKPDVERQLSGITVHKVEKAVFKFSVRCFKEKFAPVVACQMSPEQTREWQDLKTQDYSNGCAHYEITVPFEKGFIGRKTLKIRPVDCRGYYSTSTDISSDFINSDDSTIETNYRVHLDKLPQIGEVALFKSYDSTKDITSLAYMNECRISNDIAVADHEDLSLKNIGPDLSIKPEKQYVTLAFDCPKMFNFYFDLEDADGNTFETDKYGRVKDVDILAAVSPTPATSTWIDCNGYYDGYSSSKGVSLFNGLDLFRSDKKRKYVTFGRNPNLTEGKLYLHIGFTSTINLKTLVSSIKESLDERR